MIKVEIKYIGNNFEKLKVSGHANFAEEGKDLVCAAVSSIITGGLNNLELIDYYNVINFDKGLVEINFEGKISSHDKVVIETVLKQLKTIEDVYPKYIKITEKGKY